MVAPSSWVGRTAAARYLGTEIETEWLRHRTFERVEVAPAIEERHVGGRRVLVVYVAEASELVEDPDRGSSRGRITSGDYAGLTGLTQPGALKALDRMARDCLLACGDPHGRNAHYVLRPDAVECWYDSSGAVFDHLRVAAFLGSPRAGSTRLDR